VNAPWPKISQHYVSHKMRRIVSGFSELAMAFGFGYFASIPDSARESKPKPQNVVSSDETAVSYLLLHIVTMAYALSSETSHVTPGSP